MLIEIRAQGSVVHPRRDDGWHWTKAVGNPTQWKNVLVLELIPLGEVSHQPLEIMFSYH